MLAAHPATPSSCWHALSFVASPSPDKPKRAVTALRKDTVNRALSGGLNHSKELKCAAGSVHDYLIISLLKFKVPMSIAILV